MSHAGKVFAVAFLAALGWAVVPVAEVQPPIRIGASPSQTGALAALGQNQLRGYQLCAKHVNDKGGVLGRKVELVAYDDGSDPATAVRLYEQLITVPTAPAWLQRAEMGGLTAGEGGTRWGSAGAGALMLLVLFAD